MANDENIVGWFTSNGKHIPLREGESKEEALKRSFDKKEREISRTQEESDELNSKESDTDTNFNKAEPKDFVKSLHSAKASRPIVDKWRVDEHTAEEIVERGGKCFVSKGGSTVVVDKDGDIISVCKAMGDRSIHGSDLLQIAVKAGGVKLDSFYGNNGFYCANGFQPVCYTPFNEKYAPDGWRESGCGQEPVVFYRYVGIGRVKNTDITKLPVFTGDDGYEMAQKYRDSH